MARSGDVSQLCFLMGWEGDNTILVLFWCFVGRDPALIVVDIACFTNKTDVILPTIAKGWNGAEQ